MTELLCGYEYESDDDYPFDVRCTEPKGHSGDHVTHVHFVWPTRPVDICRERGHDWGRWGPVQPGRQDISDVLLASLLPGLTGHLETIKEPTQERVCLRCNSYDNDGERKWVGPSPMPISVGQPLDRDFTGTKLVWTEDRLSGGGE